MKVDVKRTIIQAKAKEIERDPRLHFQGHKQCINTYVPYLCY